MLDTPRPDYHGLIRSEIFQVLPEQASAILDVGGGYGATASAVRDHFDADKCVVVDIAPCREGLAEGVDAFVEGDIQDTALGQSIREQHGSFDLILCLDILEHLVDPWRAVKEMHSLLAPDGVIVASVPNVNHFSCSLPLFFGGKWQLKDKGILDRTHLRFFVKDTAVSLMTSSGLNCEKVGPALPERGRKAWLAHKASLGGLERFFALQYLIRVRKSDSKVG